MSLTFTQQKKPSSTLIPAKRGQSDHKTTFQPPRTEEAPLQPGFGHEFGKVDVLPRERTGPQFPQSCPLALPTPRACPFGGACHTCPAPVQAKLTISQPGDRYEQEADRVAGQVMAMPEPRNRQRLQRECDSCEDDVQRQPEEEEEEASAKLLQRQPEEEEEEEVSAKLLQLQPEEEEKEELTNAAAKARPGHKPAVSSGVAADIQALRSRGGQALSPVSRAFFEPRFGHDFSRVRVHNDSKAADTAQAVRAKAFTVGRDIAFGGGKYAPDTHGGRRLMAHELAHVVQQGDAPLKGKAPTIQRKAGENLIQRAVGETKQDSHAGLFELTRHNPLGGPTFAPQAQYDVRLEFQPYRLVFCDEIAMTQTVLSRTGGAFTPPSAAARSRQLTAAEGTEGVTLDRFSGRTSPLYGMSNVGTAEGQAHFGSRTGKGIGDKAWIEDTPGWPGPPNRVAGVTDSSHFETCAICNDGTDEGVYYGCVNWGYDIDAANKFTEDSFTLVSKGTPSADFLAAAKEWNVQTVPVATDDLPLPTHKTKQTSMTEAQLKAEINTLKTTLKALAAGHVDIPQITFEIKVYKVILGAMAYNRRRGYSASDIKAIQALVGSTPNGTYDFNTITSIKKWQVEQGLSGDGRFGPKSKKQFDAIVKAAVTANKGEGFTVDQIKKIQRKVGSKDDGDWGPITVKHLMVWQEGKNLLSPTGFFDFLTKFLMFGLFSGF